MIKKFRAWDKGLKEMFFIDNIFNMTEKFSERGKLGYFILMQFTGLLDKNGVKIYENDVIKTLYGLEGIVEFNNGSYVCKGLPIGQFYSKEIEVVGNIYNNKELIK